MHGGVGEFQGKRKFSLRNALSNLQPRITSVAWLAVTPAFCFRSVSFGHEDDEPNAFLISNLRMDMSDPSRPTIGDEVELLLDNARLRDELEPYRDESIDDTSVNRMPLHTENEYLASMLAWERAPALPISCWFSPPLQLPSPDSLGDEQLHDVLHETIQKLFDKHVILRFTDHLCDRDLYKIIYRDILPSCEKKVEVPGKSLEWRCVEDDETWLRFYANAVDRRRFQEDHEIDLPKSEEPRFKRQLPGN